MSNGGWLSTKKSRSQIEKDKAAALRAKRSKLGKPKKKKKARDEYDESEEEEEPEWRDSGDEEEDEDDLGDFIADDEDEDEEEEFSVHGEDEDDDDDDEELEVLPPQTNRTTKPGSKKPTTTQRPRGSSSAAPLQIEDSDSDDGGFLGSMSSGSKARPSKPSVALSRASIAAKTRPNPGLGAATKQTKLSFFSVPAVKKPGKKTTKPTTAATKKRTKQSKRSLVDSDEDDELLSSPSPVKASRFFNNASKPPQKRARNSIDSLATTVSTSRSSSPRILVDSDDDDENTPVSDPPPRRPTSDDWMDSPEPVANPRVKKKTMKKKTISSTNPFAAFAADAGDESMDEDERVALKHALKKSLEDSEPVRLPSSKTTANDKDDEEVVEIDEDGERILTEDLRDSSDDEEEEDADDDEFDEERRAATSVLHTAQELSAFVLKAMSNWGAAAGNASEGMIIVDGALSMGGGGSGSAAKGPTTTTNGAGSNNKYRSRQQEWVSQETMRTILPNVTLSDYQLIGVNWLALLHGMKCNIDQGSSGSSSSSSSRKKPTNVNGVLADEMGLGKTVQTIAFLAWLKHHLQQQQDDEEDGEPHAPHLIVVPVSVLPNWVREFETFAPDLHVVKYHGSMAEREELQEQLSPYLPSRLKKQQSRIRSSKWSGAAGQGVGGGGGRAPLDVILAPITYFQKEKSDDRKFLNKFQFEYLVVDEAHMLKNSQSTRYKTLDRVKTRHRLLLTGTPVQNSPQELLNMLCFLMPLFSSPGSFLEEDEKANTGERMLHHFVEHEKIEEGGDEQEAYKKLKHLFAPFVLRRKKADVIAQLLPPKEQVVEYVEMDPSARKIYDDILAAHVHKNGSVVTAAIGDHLFTNLRKAAHHPLLLRTRHTAPEEVAHMVKHFHKYGAFKGEGCTRARVEEELSRFNDFHVHLTALELIDENRRRRPDLERYILPEEALFGSAKFARLRTLLPELVRKDHRILIFSVWTSCLDLLGCLMEHLGLDYLRMDGSLPSNERQELIDRFNKDASIPVFLLSTKACGLGINLTAADTCIIHDLDFNPFNDKQAEDRCHRIGQKKPVTVYKMVAKDTVDSDIHGMQERKSKMNDAIMETKEQKKERKEMLQTAVKRFLGSPGGKAAKRDGGSKENEVISLL